MATAALHRYTPEEYLAMERGAPFKSEYRDGRIVAMVGASSRHVFISGSILTALRNHFRGGPCRAYASDLRVHIRKRNQYLYPDVVALCEEPRFEDDAVDTLLNPSLVVEVLSESTEAYDRGDKFAAYRQIESLQEYVLVAQHRVLVERYRRSGDIWALTSFESLDDVLELESVGASLPLAEVYEGTDPG